MEREGEKGEKEKKKKRGHCRSLFIEDNDDRRRGDRKREGEREKESTEQARRERVKKGESREREEKCVHGVKTQTQAVDVIIENMVGIKKQKGGEEK